LAERMQIYDTLHLDHFAMATIFWLFIYGYTLYVAKRLDASTIKMPLGMEVDLSLRDIVLNGDPVPSPKGGGVPQFSAHVYCGQTAAWIKMPHGTEVDLGADNTVLDGDPSPISKRGRSPLPNFRLMSIVAKRLGG